MGEKRFVTIESGIDYGVIDTLTGERIFDEDITEKLNEIYVKGKESYNFGVDTKAKQLYTKTAVDDIIGIVKTDEHTDSVALKKEAQLSICEKRLIKLEKENEQLRQAYTQLEHRHSLLHDECIDAECDRDRYYKDVLSLEKENEQLKKEIQSINKDLTQIMLILLDDDIASKLTEIELKAFERLSKFKGDDLND